MSTLKILLGDLWKGFYSRASFADVVVMNMPVDALVLSAMQAAELESELQSESLATYLSTGAVL